MACAHEMTGGPAAQLISRLKYNHLPAAEGQRRKRRRGVANWLAAGPGVAQPWRNKCSGAQAPASDKIMITSSSATPTITATTPLESEHVKNPFTDQSRNHWTCMPTTTRLNRII
jgi:hypothetical protein